MGTTLAPGRFSEIEVFNHLIPPNSRHEHEEREDNIWLSWQKTKRSSDVYGQSNVWQPGRSTGRHTHPGHSLVIVTAGTVATYEATIPAASPLCTQRGWGLSIPVVGTCTFSGTKATSCHKPSLFSSFRQLRRFGLTLQTRGTAISDENELIRRRCEGFLARFGSARPGAC